MKLNNSLGCKCVLWIVMLHIISCNASASQKLEVLPYLGSFVNKQGKWPMGLPLQLFVTLVNRSDEPIVVFSNIAPQCMLRGSRSPYIKCSFAMKSWVNETKVVPPMSEVGPVRLQPGQAVGIEIELPIGEAIEVLEGTFEYVVENEVAAAYGAWAGRVESPLLLQLSKVELEQLKRRP